MTHSPELAAGARSYQERRTAAANEKIGQFADLLAEGYTINQAAEAMGVGQWAARTWFFKIRKGLGWQAK